MVRERRRSGLEFLLWVTLPRQWCVQITSGVCGESETIGMKADLQSRTSGVEGIAVMPGGSPDRAFIAEAVEKVGAMRILVIMIQDSDQLRNFDSLGNFALNHCFRKFIAGDFFNSLSQNRKFGILTEPLYSGSPALRRVSR